MWSEWKLFYMPFEDPAEQEPDHPILYGRSWEGLKDGIEELGEHYMIKDIQLYVIFHVEVE
jgi:hypothetical protein